MNTSTSPVLRASLAACGFAAGAYCVFAAYNNGSMLADGVPGIMFGVAFAAVVVASWLMLPKAETLAVAGSSEAWLWRAGWLLALGFVLANAITYSAHYRVEAVNDKVTKIDGYQEAKADKARAVDDLAALKKNARWDATKGCSDTTAERSKDFCSKVSTAQERVQHASGILAVGRPGSADAGAETLAWVLDGDAVKTGRALPVYWSIVLELVASLCMKGAFASAKVPGRGKVSPLPVPEPLREPITLRAVPAQKPKTRAKPKALPAPNPVLAAYFPSIDGRNRRAKKFAPANDC